MDKKIIVTVLITLGIVGLGVGGYFLVKEFVLEDTDSNETGNGNSENESVSYELDDTTVDVETGDEEWPSDIPSDIPEFEYGDAETVAKVENEYAIAWTIVYENISENAFEKYKQDLEDEGFTNVSSFESSTGWLITVMKEPFTVVATYDKEEGTVGISVTETLE